MAARLTALAIVAGGVLCALVGPSAAIAAECTTSRASNSTGYYPPSSRA